METFPAYKSQAETILLQLFQRNGYVRQPSSKRRKTEKHAYKKGYEVRLILKNSRELADAQKLLRQLGLNPGKPFKKVGQSALPVYGRKAMEFFLRESRS